MAGELTFAGQTITSAGWMHLAQRRAAAPSIKEISFPNSTGWAGMNLGESQSRQSSLGLTFAEQGIHRNRITGSSVAAVIVTRNAVEALFLAQTRGTVAWGTESESYMVINFFDTAPGGPQPLVLGSTTVWSLQFVIQFSRSLG